MGKTTLRKKNAFFFLLWAALIFIFFSFSKSKLIPYILPIFPPLALLVAHYLELNKKNLGIGIRISFACLLILSSVIAIAFFSFTKNANIPNPAAASFYLPLAAAILLVGAICANFYIYRHCLARAIIIVLSSTAFFLLTCYAAVPAIDGRTITPLVNILKPILTPQDKVIAYNQYYQDLPFYLQRRITILNWKNELSFGCSYQDCHTWMINDYTFWQHWHSSQRLFVIMGLKEYEQFRVSYSKEIHFLLGKTVNNVLISNKSLDTHSTNPKHVLLDMLSH